MSNDRSVRLSQTLAPFGVGAIYDFVGESLVACDTAMWKNHGTPLRLRRLEDQLQVSGFRSAPSHVELFGASGPRVPYARFPQWLFCPRCRRMSYWRRSDEEPGEAPKCRMDNCRGSAQLVPMRFIVICEDSHMDEVPWQLWAHRKASSPEEKQCRSRDLSFVARSGGGTGLASLSIRCNSCKSSNSLAQLSASDSLKHSIRCQGRQPWQRDEAAETCQRIPQVVQRGATNVYFATVASALDIPPESDYSGYADVVLDMVNTSEFSVVAGNPNGPIAAMLIKQLADTFGISEERVRAIVQEHLDEKAGRGGSSPGSAHDLATDEWLAFQKDRDERDFRDRFITRRIDFDESSGQPSPTYDRLTKLVSRVVVATRLREVRALVGFSRLRPDARQVDPALGRDGIDWLPAIEVFGEGIFLALDEVAVGDWERQPEVAQAATRLEQRRQSSLFGPRLGVTATPRFVLLHTLAHLLIRQLAFDCGYAASSLRERIYAQRPEEEGVHQAGALIYTAAGDAEGTLGGLVRRGEPPRLRDTLMRAIENAAWCSADPLCRESAGQGFGALNIGACHACALVSETSCAHFNVLLDRGFLVGSDEVPGFFQPVLDSAMNEAAQHGSSNP